MEDRQHREDDIALAETHPGRDLQALGDEVPVREHDALRRPRRAARIEDGRGLARCRRQPREPPDAPPPSARTTSGPAHPRERRDASGPSSTDSRGASVAGGSPGCARGSASRAACAAGASAKRSYKASSVSATRERLMSQVRLDLLRRRQRMDHRRHRAELRRGVEGDHALRARRHRDHDPLPGASPSEASASAQRSIDSPELAVGRSPAEEVERDRLGRPADRSHHRLVERDVRVVERRRNVAVEPQPGRGLRHRSAHRAGPGRMFPNSQRRMRGTSRSGMKISDTRIARRSTVG